MHNLVFPARLDERVHAAKARGLERQTTLAHGIDFSSNDYLGFASDASLRARVHARVRELPLGSTGSRLLSGHSETFAASERKLAAFSGQETALIYASGYQANVGLFSALLRAGDRVYSDQLNHASIIDGIRLSGAEKRIYRHRELSHLEELLQPDGDETGLRLIVTESVFSMEGTFAPLRELAELARRYDAFLVVDEAHATGLWGGGRVPAEGLASQTLATLHTGGKALGTAGAWVAGSEKLRHYLLQFSRAQIFSTATSPWIAAALAESVDYWQEVGVARAEEMRARLRTISGDAHWNSPIYPWLCGSAEKALATAARLQALGFDVRAIRPPTVPDETSRLRLTSPWGRTTEDATRLRLALMGELA